VGSGKGVVSYRTVDDDFVQYPTLSGERSVLSITEYNGDLIVGGGFDDRIVSWNSSAWEPLGGGANRDVIDLVVYNNTLIAAGRFSMIGGKDINGMASWDGNSWSDVGGSLEINSGNVRDMVVHKNEIYVVGSFTEIGNTAANYVAKWNSSAWESLNLIDNMESIWAVEVYNNRLYIGTSNFPESQLYYLDL